MLVSFVIPSHNCAEFLGVAVESVRNQTHKDLEIIVVNDDSTDSTGSYLKWLVANEPRARVITNKEKLGRSESRNIGNLSAGGEFIYVLDADDICLPRRVEITLPMFKRAQFVHGGAKRISHLGFEIGPLMADKFDLEKTKRDPFLQSFIVHSTVAYTKEFSQKFPYRQEAAPLGLDDWDQQIRAAKAGERFEFTPNYLSYYRENEQGISNNRTKEEFMAAKLNLHPELRPVVVG